MQASLTLLAFLFSTPWTALAVAGGVASIPVILHLLNRKRYVVVNWAAMRFLLAAQKKNVRRLKLEQWFLLAVRIALVVLLVAAMASVMSWAEPLWQRIFPGKVIANQQQGRIHRVIVIDGSFTMATKRSDEITRFETAKNQARTVLERSNPGDGFSLVFLTNPAQTIVAGPADDRTKIAREIDDLKLPHGSADVAGGLHSIAEIVGRPLGKYQRRELYLLSDFRHSSWPMPQKSEAERAPAAAGSTVSPPAMAVGTANSISESWQRILTNCRIAWIDVAGMDVDQLAVTSITLSDPLPLTDVDMGVSVIVQNFGRKKRDQVPVELLIGRVSGTERVAYRSAGNQKVDLPAGDSVTLTFPIEKQNRFTEPGEYVLQARIPEDALRLDDSRSLAVHVRNTIPVMVVSGKSSPEPLRDSGKAVANGLYPFPGKEQLPGYPARTDRLMMTDFEDVGRGDLTKCDVVFLCDLPRIGTNEVLRLEAHLKRGGSVVIGLGPNAAENLEAYNRILFNEGKGILPGRLIGVRKAGPDEEFNLTADEESFKQPPLSGLFLNEVEKAGLAIPSFKQYVRIDTPPNGPARRVLGFVPAKKVGTAVGGKTPSVPDAAVLEWPRYRGRVILYTSSFNVDWTNWPRTLTFPPFLQELLRFAVVGGTRQTVLSGEMLEEFVPIDFAGLDATFTYSDGLTSEKLETVTVNAEEGAGLVRFRGTDQRGIYLASVGNNRSVSVFSVNVPITTPSGGSESDLRRLTPVEIQTSLAGGDIEIQEDVTKLSSRDPVREEAVANVPELREPSGPAVARVILFALLGLLLLESFLAWYYGSARSSTNSEKAVTPSRWLQLVGVVPIILSLLLVVVVLHAIFSGQFLGFLPTSWRVSIERVIGVPAAAPGEGTRWHLDLMAYITNEFPADYWLIASLFAVVSTFAIWIYRRERPVIANTQNSRFRNPIWILSLLRLGFFGILLTVLLPQLRLVFEREGWPDIVLIFDESQSMATVDTFRDPQLQARTEELKHIWSELAKPRIAQTRESLAALDAKIRNNPELSESLQSERTLLQQRLQSLQTPHRLNLVKALLASGSRDWFQTFVNQRQLRVQVYRASGQTTRMAELSNPEQCKQMLEDIIDLVPSGDSSQLGNSVTSVLKTFRGSSLHAIIMFTDGVNSKGEDLPQSARLASKMGVPLYFVGVGDTLEPPDVVLSDLKAEDSIHVNDRLIIEATVKAQGQGMPDSVPVILSEIKDGKPVELRREMVRMDGSGKPVKVRFVHQPKEIGEKTLVVEVPKQVDETDTTNNRIEHLINVTESKRVRVLMIEGYPRYEFRYLKTLFERETDQARNSKSIDFFTYLLSADPRFPEQDRSALARFPTLEELKTYDVVILGDVDPRLLPRAESNLRDLGLFVKERGGGLLLIAGEQSMPQAYRETAFADILPVICDTIPPRVPNNLGNGESYRPRLTSAGLNHPIFRFVNEDSENINLWNQLVPLKWAASGYRRKLSAEVLAVHPQKLAEAASDGASNKEENHPLVLQQFVGAGRVMFFGFDDTWRWRFRQDEVRFNQFWIQTIRSLARSRVGRVEVRLDRKVYRRDESVRVTVRFPDDIPPPPPDVPVRVLVERTPPKQLGQPVETEIQTLQLTAREGTRATYETLLTRTPEGNYRFTLSQPQTEKGAKPHAETRILPPPGEMDRIQLNETDLQRAARDSRGGYYSLIKADSLPDELPTGPRVALDQPCPPLPLWNHWSIFALSLSLLLSEWMMRKWWRLL